MVLGRIAEKTKNMCKSTQPDPDREDNDRIIVGLVIIVPGNRVLNPVRAAFLP